MHTKIKNLFFLLFSFFFSFSLFADYAYNAEGDVSKIYIPGNGETCYAYDPIGRLTEAHYPNGKSFSYSYDFNSRLTAIKGPLGTTSFFHNLISKVERVKLPCGKEIIYQYDYRGRLTQIVYPDGEAIDYQYDDRGRLVKMKDPSGITNYEYDDETNLILKEILPNGISTSYAYDDSFNVSEVLHQNQKGLIAHYRYIYDGGGNCISMEVQTPNNKKITVYEYDLLNRLTLAKCSNGEFERYIYDALGNRLTKETASETIFYVYDIHNRLIQEGNTRYEYDSVGNLIQKNSPEKKVSYSYDPTGKLIAYNDGISKVEFEYDGLGQRTSKTVNGKTTHFINDPISPLSRVLMEITPTGETKKYSYGLSRTAQKTEEGFSYFLYSHPGKNVSHLVSHNGTVAELEYDAFGVPNTSTPQAPYGFNGEEKDEETGLIYLRHRYYDPATGRFISPDAFLGNLKKPQTLNPYAFALNNPITYIDPDGFSEIKVFIDLYVNPPGTILPSGQMSYGGHAWIGYTTAGGQRHYVGVHSGPDFRLDDNITSLCAKTEHMRVWVTPEVQEHAIRAMYDNHYNLITNNCVDHVIKVLDAISYPHPHFGLQEEGDISNPAAFCNWISNEKHHIHPNFLPQKGDILIGGCPSSLSNFLGRDTHHSFIDLHFCHPNYGGVLLDKSAEVFTELRDISGVFYDEQMGQMIFYGQKNLSLPYMDTDDLAVAVRSIYGLGSKAPESPGVSMEPGFKNPKKKKDGCMVVSYFGETENTRFGQVMFESDRILKVLSIGRDNITGKSIRSSVPGYRSLQEIQEKEGFPPPNTHCRLWFVPQRITLSESFDGTSMVFNEARMEVLTESMLRKKGIVEDKAAEKFAKHFTNYYDQFSEEYPILAELKRLGKITAIVKWIYEKNLPFDLSFFKGYTPAYYETPKYSPAIANMLGGQLILGGVVYTLTEGNYHVQRNEQAETLKEEILRERPNDGALSWDFGRGLTAVAKQVSKVLKVGEVSKVFVDLAYPNQSKIPLAFVRTYSSFNDDCLPFGRGWSNTLAKLSFNHPPASLEFSDGSKLNAYPEITTHLEGVETTYYLAGLNDEKRPVYTKKGTPLYLVHDQTGNFQWALKNERLMFDSKGTLIRIEDLQGQGITYEYEAKYLVRIVDDWGNAISFAYVGDQIFSIQGPGEKIIYYEYYPNGFLQTVRDDEGNLAKYEYDEGGRLAVIYNGRDNKIFEAKYDEHHRAIEQVVGESFVSHQFNLCNRTAFFEGSNNYSYQEQFDPKYRPEVIQDALGREIQFVYGQDEGPQKLTTNTGLEVDYEYDSQGNLSKIYDVFRGERRFTYNSQGQVTYEKDGEGVETVYQYDDKGHLVEKYHPFFLSSIGVVRGQPYVQGNTSYLISFNYNQATGLLDTITFPGGRKETYQYDNRGLPIEVRLPDGTTVVKEYDERGRLKRLETKGKSISYSYDQRDRVKRMSSQGKETSFSYDEAGNLSSLTDPLNRTTHHNYDRFERLTQTVDPDQGMTSYEYTSSGLSRINLPNGSNREILYDDYGRLVSIR
ncbi:MAG: hypothetical protein KDK76_02760 [Chlamydiia bacterium]|nr:hypothetical protein [Chlamydiia bacterium]